MIWLYRGFWRIYQMFLEVPADLMDNCLIDWKDDLVYVYEILLKILVQIFAYLANFNL